MRFDEGMNDLPMNLIPSNQRDIERVEQGNKFPVEPNEVMSSKKWTSMLDPEGEDRQM